MNEPIAPQKKKNESQRLTRRPRGLAKRALMRAKNGMGEIIDHYRLIPGGIGVDYAAQGAAAGLIDLEPDLQGVRAQRLFSGGDRCGHCADRTRKKNGADAGSAETLYFPPNF